MENIINSQFSNNYYIKLINLGNITFFRVEKGNCYIAFTNIKKLDISFRDNTYSKIGIETNIKVLNWSIFTHVKLKKILKKYSFSESEIILLSKKLAETFSRYKLKDDIDAYIDEYPHIIIKAYILIEILFKTNNLILFNNSGLSIQTSYMANKWIYEKLKQSPNKSAIIIDENNKLRDTIIKQLSEEVLKSNILYERWLLSIVNSREQNI